MFFSRSPEPDLLKRMYECSPIAHADKLTGTPVLLLIGKGDLRVPHNQGYEFFYQLKALGKEVEMNLYDDNHPLGKVPNDVNVYMNSVLFMNKAVMK